MRLGPYLRSCLFVGAAAALASCSGQVSSPSAPVVAPPNALSNAVGTVENTGKTSGAVLLLVPLSGPLAPVGEVLANAAKLALPVDGTPRLDIRDTQGTPQGAASAAQAGLAAGDGIILGPLTANDAKAVIPLAKQAGVNMLPFTNDGALAAPGVWPLGITPAQQVARVVQQAAASGHTQLAGLLPDSDFGRSLANALQQEARTLGEPAPQIAYYEPGFSSLNQTIRQLSDWDSRGVAHTQQINQARSQDTAAGMAKANALRMQQIAPPSFNALFIGATDANSLAEIASFLSYYEVFAPQVQFMGPTLWANLAKAMATQPSFVGAFYAAPDPQAATLFQAKYDSLYGSMPPGIADIAFDATALAKLASSSGGYTTKVLTSPSGFAGADGVLVLMPDGHVKRGLVVFAISHGQPTVVSPAPTSFKQP